MIANEKIVVVFSYIVFVVHFPFGLWSSFLYPDNRVQPFKTKYKRKWKEKQQMIMYYFSNNFSIVEKRRIKKNRILLAYFPVAGIVQCF